MRVTILFLTLGLLLHTSCGQEKSHEHADADAVESHDHHAAIAPEEIQLNNGEKWVANKETTDGIKRLQSLAEGYSGQNVDAAHLAEDMLVAYQEIFDKCTMKGEAHEQLHHYLMPLGAHLEEIKACTTGCGEHVQHVQAYLNTYFTYFQ